MNMIHYDPYRLLSRGNDIHQLVDSLFPRLEREEATAGYDWSPAVDIREKDSSYVIHADVPGIKPQNIDVSLEDGVLTIQGTRAFDNEESKNSYKRIERVRGKFYRRFNLPDTADHNKVSAKCNDGVLEVVIEKQAKSLPKKITVSA